MIHDVMVIGAGVAGATAAALSAGQGQRVVLIERARRRPPGPRCPDWLTPPALAMLDELRVRHARCVGKPFEGAVFYPADLARVAETRETRPPGFRVDYAQLLARLRDRAAKMGVACLQGAAPARLEASDHDVTAVFTDRDPARARFLVIADGAGGIPTDSAAPAAPWIAGASVRVKKDDRDARMHWVLGLEGGKSLGCWWFDGPEAIIRLHGPGSPDSARAQFQSMVARICERGFLPGDLAVKDADVCLSPAPARHALESDSHVGKHTLRIGDAGGFFAAASREGIYPAMWSARLAVETIIRAADCRHPQDELRQFGTRWRTTMAEYLRPPNTDLQFLLPLIFTNQQMADRMAAAFWRGENI